MKILLTNPTLENERDVTDPLLPLGMISIVSYLRENLDELYEIWLDFKKLTQKKTRAFQLRDGIRRPVKSLLHIFRKLRWKIGT